MILIYFLKLFFKCLVQGFYKINARLKTVIRIKNYNKNVNFNLIFCECNEKSINFYFLLKLMVQSIFENIVIYLQRGHFEQIIV